MGLLNASKATAKRLQYDLVQMFFCLTEYGELCRINSVRQ